MLDEREILQIIGEELSHSAGGNENDFIESNRQSALAYYLGQPNGKEVKGRSTVVSTDVADAIEWIMPEIVKAFTQNNEVVTFDACSEGDEDQAELESKYVYDVLMKDNPGFLVIHEFIKDALLQKNGIFKVFYEKEESVRTESYTGLSDDALNTLLSDPNVDIAAITSTESEVGVFHDVKVSIRKSKGKVNVICVPPEEFRLPKMHNSVDLSKVPFCAHVTVKTVSDLIKEGYDKDVIESATTPDTFDYDREYRFSMQGETVEPNSMVGSNKAMRYVEVSECYAHIDINEDGIAEYVKITALGGDEPDVILDIEEIDEHPFIGATAILMSHKFSGLSIYDRLKQLQDQKTTLWRNILDNMYLQNNQRTIVVENQVNLDDLLVSRPGGVIRVKRPDAVMPYQTPALPSDAYKMLDYLDTVRASRSGVTPETPIADTMIGNRVGSEGVEKMMTQREELVGLMIRVLAETGIKPLCMSIRNQLIKHQDTAKDYLFRGRWVSVAPQNWRDRSHTTVRVGTGSGNRQGTIAAITGILAAQEKILANPNQALVTEAQVFNALNDLAKMSGLPGVGKYLLDPASPEGQQHKQVISQNSAQMQQLEQQKEQALAEAQMKIAKAEEDKAKASMANVQLKAQTDSMKQQIDLMEKEANAQIAMLKQQLEEAKLQASGASDDAELQFKYWEARERFSVELARIEAQLKKDVANARKSENSSGNGN